MPDPSRHLLILGGTALASALAEAASARFGDRLEITTSLAGRTSAPRQMPGRLRIGGFGGAAGLAEWMVSNRVGLAVDATHPFAAAISANLCAACDAAGVPRLALTRPPWRAVPGDRWIDVAGFVEAAVALAGIGPRIFLSVGSQKLEGFASANHVHFVVRMIDPPRTPLPLHDCSVVLGRGPFEVAAEADLLRRERIDGMVSRNSGGTATYAKIAAARELGLPVVMIAPPPPPAGPRAEELEGALQWIATELATVVS